MNKGINMKALFLGLAGFALIVYALTGCSKGPSAEDRGYLAGCNDTARAVLAQFGYQVSDEAAVTRACAKLLELSKQAKADKK